jgi:hypothetical protein
VWSQSKILKEVRMEPNYTRRGGGRNQSLVGEVGGGVPNHSRGGGGWSQIIARGWGLESNNSKGGGSWSQIRSREVGAGAKL